MGHSQVFAKGSLLLFDPFYFPDGGTPKAKYFIVLHNDGGNLLLASLPTSKDHVPADVTLASGCIELPERNFNAFVFVAGDDVTDTFSFHRNTFIYGANIHAYNPGAILRPVDNKLSAMKVLGTIKGDVFRSLVECLKGSASVRRRYKAML